jgi:sensor domain CHASE-containing protein
MTKTIRVLAYTATALAVMAVATVLFLANWLFSHEASIEQLLLTGNEEYNQMRVDSLAWNSHKRERAYVHLKEFHGLHWDEGMMDWVNHAIKNRKR